MEISNSPYLKHLYVCLNKRATEAACSTDGAGEAILQKLKAYVKANGLKGKVRVSGSGCMDLCAQGPNVMVYPDHRWYQHVSLADVDRIIEEQLAPFVPANHPELVEGELFRPSTGSGRTVVPIEAFLFDLGNVLVRFDHMILANKVTAHAGMDAQRLFQTFFDSPLVVAHDEGKISAQEFHRGLQQDAGLSLDFKQFMDFWNGIFSENQEMVALVRQLLQRYPCFLISNTNRAHFEFCAQNYPVLQELTGLVLSYEVGYLKPHPAIYRRALDLARVSPSRIFYIDDRQDLIDAASRMGFQTHRFTGEMAPLLKELENRGVALSNVRSASTKRC